MTKNKLSKGCLLISEPFLGDSNFERSVVLLCEHNENGSFGLILNQHTSLTLKDVWEGASYSDIPLFIGGPVEQNTLHFVHRLGNLIENTYQISEGLYWSGDYEQLMNLINLGKIQENDIRFFLGYAGWISGQLEQEMKRNSWIITQVEADFIFDTAPEQFWRSILKKMGGKHKILSNYPTDPRLN